MSQGLKGRAALVTGGSSGIGRAIAEALAAQGMEVWISGRTAASLEEAVEAIRAAGGSAHPILADLAEPGAGTRTVEAVSHSDLAAVINAAGLMYPETILDADPARWRELMAVNLLGTLEACQAGVRKMRAQGRPGRLINFSSLVARWDAGGVYGASKIAVEMITRTLHRELEGDDIRATVIVPGGFATNLARGFLPEDLARLTANAEATGYAMDRLLGDPKDIARTVVFLLEQPIDLSISELVIRPPADLVI